MDAVHKSVRKQLCDRGLSGCLCASDQPNLARHISILPDEVGRRISQRKSVGGFCCPAPPGPRLPNHLGSEGHFIIVGTYTSSPITAEQYRAKDQPLHVRRSCFAPIDGLADARAYGGGAGYRPRVRAAYYAVVYRHSRTSRRNRYRRALVKIQRPALTVIVATIKHDNRIRSDEESEQ